MGKKAKGSAQTLKAFDGGNAPTEKMSAARRRQLERRDTDEQVERDIQARFPNLCSSETDVRLLDGKCLRDTIRDDKRLAKREGRKLGPKYWQLLSQKVASLTSHVGHLVVKNNTEPVDAKLCEAMKAMHSTNTSLRNRTLLTEWLATSKAPNQRTVVGVFKATQQSAPAANLVALLEPFSTFEWLLTEDLQAKAKAIICEVYSDSQRKPALLKRSILQGASSASASSSFVRPSYKKAKSMEDVSLEDVVMSMFD